MKTLCISLLLLISPIAFTQSGIETVTGLPTNELNDLHIDKKGYLWIAHELGISRYDGLHFINYSHPSKISLRTIDLVEDPQGRIWFHNFSGQVYFIENGKLSLLASYDYKKENQNPRMALCGNDLLISSFKGLFICNTATLKSRFISFERTSVTAVVSIAVADNKAVIYNGHDWYLYTKGSLTKMEASFTHRLPKDNFFRLSRSVSKDTLFLTANPSGIMYKLKQEGQKLTLVNETEFHDYINNISVDKETWVHTRNQSVSLTSGRIIPNTDLTDIVTGREGNTWYGSRRNGLLVQYRPSLWKRSNFQLNNNDYIRSLNANAGYFFAGTQEGTLYRFATDSSNAEWKQELFNGLGSIDFIRYINNDLFVVGSSTDTYIVDASKKKIITSLSLKGILDVDFDGSSFYVATAVGLYIVPFPKGETEKQKWIQEKKKQFPFFNWNKSADDTHLLFPVRTLSVRFDSVHHLLYAATKNGLIVISEKGPYPYLIEGKEVIATSLAFKNSTLYVATINNGLWIIENNKKTQFTTTKALSSNTIIRLKLTEDHLWLFEEDGIQIFDIHSKRLLTNIDLPKIQGSNILDVTEKGEWGYLATATGTYKVPLHLNTVQKKPTGFLDYIIINGRDTVYNSGVSVSHQQNDFQFYFSSPVFYDPSRISFRYRLLGAEDDWRVTLPGERMIRYSTVAPGDYTFELYAVNSAGLQQKNIIRFPFTVKKPWWRTIWFILLLNVFIVAFIYFIIQNGINQKLKLELLRRNISHDLHDDIGATLSSVNFYIDMAQEEKENGEYLQYIKENVNQVIGNLDDLVWSINPKNDTTEQLINRMKDYANQLLKAAHIICHFEYDPKLLNLNLDLLTKRHLYLLFKEIVNNAAKHARCQNCTIKLSVEQERLCLTVTDDGVGFDPEQTRNDRNGLTTMLERAKSLNGELTITTTPQIGSRVAIVIPV